MSDENPNEPIDALSPFELPDLIGGRGEQDEMFGLLDQSASTLEAGEEQEEERGGEGPEIREAGPREADLAVSPPEERDRDVETQLARLREEFDDLARRLNSEHEQYLTGDEEAGNGLGL